MLHAAARQPAHHAAISGSVSAVIEARLEAPAAATPSGAYDAAAKGTHHVPGSDFQQQQQLRSAVLQSSYVVATPFSRASTPSPPHSHGAASSQQPHHASLARPQ